MKGMRKLTRIVENGSVVALRCLLIKTLRIWVKHIKYKDRYFDVHMLLFSTIPM